MIYMFKNSRFILFIRNNVLVKCCLLSKMENSVIESAKVGFL